MVYVFFFVILRNYRPTKTNDDVVRREPKELYTTVCSGVALPYVFPQRKNQSPCLMTKPSIGDLVSCKIILTTFLLTES